MDPHSKVFSNTPQRSRLVRGKIVFFLMATHFCFPIPPVLLYLVAVIVVVVTVAVVRVARL